MLSSRLHYHSSRLPCERTVTNLCLRKAKKHGWQIEYDADGTVAASEFYQNGKRAVPTRSNQGIRFSVGERSADRQQAEDEQRNETLRRNREILKGVIDEGRRSGTLGLAPNGKKSNLVETGGTTLWGIVRMPQFKAWFGDWEKAARLNHINAVKPTVVQEHSLEREDLFNEYKNIGTVKNKADGREVYFSRASFGKNYKKGGLFSRAVPGLADAFENSILAYSNGDIYRGLPSKDGKSIHKIHPNISMYHNYVGKMKIGGKDYYVRYTVTEETGENPRFGVHSSFVSNVELYEAGYGDKKITTPERQIPLANLTTEEKSDRVVDTKLSEFFDAAKKSRENASKLVDENGEPKVFYHNTDAEFTVFDGSRNGSNTDAGWLGDGFYFYGDEYEGNGYGKNKMPVFLNMREPYYATSEENERLAEANNREESVAFREQLEEAGYDGVYYNGDLREEAVAFEPNQIKSVFENNGEFSADNPDIRFSVGWRGRANRGYVGYSMSERAAEAKEEGRYPKGEFAREYGVSQKALSLLTAAGIVDDSEWHHTSKYFNRTTFYGWNGEDYDSIYKEHKKEIDALAREYAELKGKERWKGWDVEDLFKHDLDEGLLDDEDTKRIREKYEERKRALREKLDSGEMKWREWSDKISEEKDKAYEEWRQTGGAERARQLIEDGEAATNRIRAIEEQVQGMFPEEEGDGRFSVGGQRNAEEPLRETEREGACRAEAEALGGRLGVDIEVVGRAEDVPEGAARRRILSDIAQGRQSVRGWYDVKTGKVYVFAPNAQSVNDVDSCRK